jgi:hypothetical protein
MRAEALKGHLDGEPMTVARACATARARRGRLRLVRSGPAIGAVWLLAVLTDLDAGMRAVTRC